jgi:hypothetical protein
MSLKSIANTRDDAIVMEKDLFRERRTDFLSVRQSSFQQDEKTRARRKTPLTMVR